MAFRLLDLADELILAIAQTTPMSDLLRLRLTCRALDEICDFPLKDRRHRLYLHPRSLYYAIDVCSVPKWSEDITEIVILGNSESTMTSRESHQFPDCVLDYHPWSQFPPTKDGERVLEYNELVDAQNNDFRQNYAALFEALEKLPRLRTISYAGSAVEPGFCSVTQSTIMAHAKQKDLWRNSFGNSGQPQMRAALRTVWWSDVEVFTHLLALIPHKFTHVNVCQPMPSVRDAGYRPGRGIDSPTVMDSFSGVISVRYTAPGPQGWSAYVDKLLHSMPDLQSLHVDIVSGHYERILPPEPRHAGATHPWEEDFDLSWSPSPIICPRRSPKLQQVILRGPSNTPYNVVADNLASALQQSTNKQWEVSTSHAAVVDHEYSSLTEIATATLVKDVNDNGCT